MNSKVPSAFVEPVSQAEIAQSVFLVGDAGDPDLVRQEPNFVLLEREASQHPEKNTIVFLGDNVYPNGIPEESDPGRAVTEQRLMEQRQLVERSSAFGVFIAGNHDWGKSHEDGVFQLEREEQLLMSDGTERIWMTPKGVAPGPAFADIGDQLRLVTLNTEWWLRDMASYVYPNTRSKSETKLRLVDSLTNIIRTAGDRRVIVVGHHPLSSHGLHSGFFDWRDHIFPLRRLVPWLWFPLPVIGSLYPFLGNQGVSNQDQSNTTYQEFVRNLDSAFAIATPLAYAAGHEHTLEVLENRGNYLMLVSGFGTAQHGSTLTHDENTLFAHRHEGFMRVDFLHDRRIRLSVIVPSDTSAQSQEVFSMWLTKENDLQH